MPNEILTPSAVLISCENKECVYELINEICHGLEEEQIPYRFWNFNNSGRAKGYNGLAKAAYLVACKSNLGVGIFIDKDGNIALHHEKLPELTPYFYISCKEINRDKARQLGADAGRLVKRQPLILHDL